MAVHQVDVEHSGNNADDSPAARADDNFESVVGILFRDKTEIYIGTEMQVRIRAEPFFKHTCPKGWQ